MDVDVVVPTAYPLAVLAETLPALRRALDEAPSLRARVVVVDERPEERDLAGLVAGLGFERLVTGGIGNGPARNRGAATGSAPWLLFVDDDIVLDPDSLGAVPSLTQRGALAVIGGLRPPTCAPRWLSWTYEDTTVNPAAAAAGEAWLPPARLAVTLLLIRREVFEAVGGFPELPVWGWVDLLFGLRLERTYGRAPQILRSPLLSGVHLYDPSWDEWLSRLERAGRRLVEIRRHLQDEERCRIEELLTLDSSPRGRLKRASGTVPLPLWRLARGRRMRKLAAAAALSRGTRRPG